MSEQPPPGAFESPRSFRWQALLQSSDQALFILDRRRRLLFVNSCWQQLTGLSIDRSRGLICRRPRPVSVDDPLEDRLAHLLTPPQDAGRGRFCRVRRLLTPAAVPGSTETRPICCDIEFFPVRHGGSPPTFSILGRILPIERFDSSPTPLLPERLENLRQRFWSHHGPELLQSQVPSVCRLAEQVRLVAGLNCPVLVVGEAGAGKRTTARLLHHLGPRREGTFLTLEANRLPDWAVAEVLNAERSSLFWKELATLYIAEADQLAVEQQRQLVEWTLRSDAPVRPRLLLGITGDAQEKVKSGQLLPELYWQVSVVTLQIPPLRERLADLPWLVERLLGDEERPVLTPAAWDILRSYQWPQNLAELRRVLLEATRQNRERIDADHLPLAMRVAQQARLEGRTAVRPIDLEATLEEVERRLIRLALSRTQGNRSRAAELLGIHRPRLLRRLEALGLGDIATEE